MRNCILPKQWVWISLQNKQNAFSISRLHLGQKKKSNVISCLGKHGVVCLCLSVSKMSGPQLHLKPSKSSKYPRFYPCPPTFSDSVFHNFNKCLANFNKHISVATNFCSFAFSSHLWGRFSIPGKPKHLLFHYLQPGSLASVEKADSPTTSNQPQWGPGRWQSGTHLPPKPPQNLPIHAGLGGTGLESQYWKTGDKQVPEDCWPVCLAELGNSRSMRGPVLKEDCGVAKEDT